LAALSPRSVDAPSRTRLLAPWRTPAPGRRPDPRPGDVEQCGSLRRHLGVDAKQGGEDTAAAFPQGLAAAELCQEVEHRFLGLPCGIMDPFAILHARPGMALFLDCRDRSFDTVPVDAERFVFEVLSGFTPHQLVASDYGKRRAECDELKQVYGWHPREDAWSNFSGAPAGLVRRARHVQSENDRVHRFVAALRSGDGAAAGALLYASHDSLSRDFEVSTPLHDATVELLRGELGRSAGVLGARITGGGFGGCLLLLRSKREGREELRDRLRSRLGAAARGFALEEIRACGGPELYA
jgi:galactokinase